jgi:hypothetical protein
MKFSRLFQPRNPLFWLIMMLNVLTAMLAWVAQTKPLDGFGLLLVGSFALCNMLLGMWLTWRLARDDPKA